jgi:hypothetical protein
MDYQNYQGPEVQAYNIGGEDGLLWHNPAPVAPKVPCTPDYEDGIFDFKNVKWE